MFDHAAGWGVPTPMLFRPTLRLVTFTGVGVPVGVGEGPAPGVAVGKALGPPPTSVGQSPQLSVTVSGTVAACPATACRTVKLVCVVLAASTTVKLPGCPAGCPGTSISAPLAAPNCRRVSWLVGVLPLVVAVMVTCSAPAPPGTTATPTAGRGAQAANGAAGAPGAADPISVPTKQKNMTTRGKWRQRLGVCTIACSPSGARTTRRAGM